MTPRLLSSRAGESGELLIAIVKLFWNEEKEELI